MTLLRQDCSATWQLPYESLDVVFSSNCLEHLPTKDALECTFLEAGRTLKPGGRFIAMGPNIKYIPVAYWDFIDHHLPLTERSVLELMRKCGFEEEAQAFILRPANTLIERIRWTAKTQFRS